MLWDTTGCTEWHRDLSEMAREDLENMGVLGHHRGGQGHLGEQGDRLHGPRQAF
jgi:hypothetical protein